MIMNNAHRNRTPFSKAHERRLRQGWADAKAGILPELLELGWDAGHALIKYTESEGMCFEELMNVLVQGTKKKVAMYYTFIVVAVHVSNNQVYKFYSDGDHAALDRDEFIEEMDKCTQNSCSVCRKTEKGDDAEPLFSCVSCNKPSHDSCLPPAELFQLGADRKGFFTCNNCFAAHHSAIYHSNPSL
jgi:hypothetical protein